MATEPRASLSGRVSPPHHADVAEALKGQNIDRATVFRNLNDLTDAGLLHRTHIGRAWNFEDGDGHKGHHAHFVCSECGLIECLDDVEIKVAPKSSKARGVPAKNYSVELSGTCDDCV